MSFVISEKINLVMFTPKWNTVVHALGAWLVVCFCRRRINMKAASA